jgi:[acyl-carrier-protein] S-malonyltransferase
MRPAEEAFAADLAAVTLREPEIPVIQNVDATVAADLEELRTRLLEQISRPVLWTACVQAMVARGVSLMVECGAGRVLCGLIKRIDKSVHTANLSTLEGLREASSKVWENP